ncbi:group II truncated hemoglobin [Streptomyces sp. 6N223]|uniref:group II truncated hemoglobin n=1 Tax=Streptomyces sp. 6N223 TaxID=3457412 RepID=UPI003FCF1CC0
MASIVEYVRYRMAARDREEFEAACRRAAASLAAAPQCVDYELTRRQDEEDEEEGDDAWYVLRIRWTSAADHLEGFREGEHFRAFLAEIGPYVAAIEEMRHYESTGIAGAGGSTPSIYEWAGGAAAFERLTEIFYGHVHEDPLLKPVFSGMAGDHPRYVAMWLAEVFGGPARYSAERGGHPHMAGKHVGRGITEEQRRRWVALLRDAADEAGLPDDPEFRAVFAYYVEWGTRMALVYSGENPPPLNAAPVPRWAWGLTPPWQPSGSA